MKKIFFLITSICFTCDLWASNSVVDEKHVEQIYLQNVYVIDHLENLARVVKKRPKMIGGNLDDVDVSLLVLKQNSLNYLFEQSINVNSDRLYRPFENKLTLNSRGLLQQNNVMLKMLPELFQRYQLEFPNQFSKDTTVGWLSPNISYALLYKQLLRIESIINGLSNSIKPIGVYEIMHSIHEVLASQCLSYADIKSVSLVMGKRPKDVYAHLYEYIDLLSQYTDVVKPARGAIHVLPQDVFDTAIIALSYSRSLVTGKNKAIMRAKTEEGYVYLKEGKPGAITPSHVYQAVSENIRLLECMTHARR